MMRSAGITFLVLAVAVLVAGYWTLSNLIVIDAPNAAACGFGHCVLSAR